jgi:elongation factor 1-alpha
MKFRLEEGNGEAIYILGVSDSGDTVGIGEQDLKRTLDILSKVANLVGSSITPLRVTEVRPGRYVAEALVRVSKEMLPIQVNVAVLGHVNAGKSTLIGVLISGKRDDGSGSLRNMVARHLHEVISGRTSSISTKLLGFDEKGRAVNYELRDPLDEAGITVASRKIVKLIDLAGHERYLRTTLKGLLGYGVDYAMLVIGLDDGLSTMGREHLGVAAVLKIPIFVVLTKVDKYGEGRIREVLNDIKSVLRVPGINRLAYVVESEDEVYNSIVAMTTLRVVPVFRVSNVTGQGIDLLLNFLNLLPSRRVKLVSAEPLAYIDEIYEVQGVGTVVLGTVIRGSLSQNQSVFIGPDDDGGFREVKIKSIQVNRVFVSSVQAKVVATFALQGVEKGDLRKGMVITHRPFPCARSFSARVFLLHHPTTIKEGYVATVHVHTIRQAARFSKIEKGYLRSGDSSEVVMNFLYRPEYLEEGQLFVFREGRTRGIGVVKKLDR